ncbi:MAG: BrnA antitoxin family protein [Gemmatimonadetes bacterium]|nr:BrnA antitoxin family protein [Gemmatimonadota bacterium]
MPKSPSKRPDAKPKPRTKAPLKAIPHFRSEDEEREFWATADSTKYFDWASARRVAFPNLKPSTATISLRLPQGLLDDLKVLANQRDVPYQSLLKVYLAERVAVERDAATRPSRRASA